jgi:hypothetical protein
MDKVSSVITSNKKYINNLLIFLIVVEHFPLKSQFPAIYNNVSPFIQQMKRFMNHPLVKSALFLVLVWSCCIKKDMDTFLLMAVFFNTYY